MKNTNFVPFTHVSFKDGFWKRRYDLNAKVSIPNVKKQFEDSGRFDALRFNLVQTGRAPHFFYDSDAAKWIEAIGYLIQKDPEGYKEEEKFIDEIVDCMERAQRPDGYLNSFHQQCEPHNIFKIRDRHELYCAGHLIEAAIAYHQATGKRKLLDIMERMCDCIEKAFFIDNTASFLSPGHQEIELALFKLYRYTGTEKYKTMAEGFLSRRADPNDPPQYGGYRPGSQDDVDIYHLRDARGHCVRALYYYSGIADMLLENGDPRLQETMDSIFTDVTERKMFITGSVGSTHRLESFTIPYDLSGKDAYAESCGAIALILYAMRMRRLGMDAKYGDVIERVMYNTLLSSTSLDGKAFFYENPLEINMEMYDAETGVACASQDHAPQRTRLEVFWCSCCPPNINRILAELGDWLVYDEIDFACIEQYAACEAKSAHGTLSIDGDYVNDGKITVSSSDYQADKIALRLPAWSDQVTVTAEGREVAYAVENGYAIIPVGENFSLELDFHIAPVLMASNPNVTANVGRVALCYGPVVYCIEGVDNGPKLNRVSVSVDAPAFKVSPNAEYGFPTIEVDGFRDADATALYLRANAITKHPTRLTFIPYYAFANRGASDMQVWIRRA